MRRKNTCSLCGPTEKVVCKIPVREPRRSQWIEFYRIASSKDCGSFNAISVRICTDHFEEKFVCRNKNSDAVRLMPAAVPSIYFKTRIERSVSQYSESQAPSHLTSEAEPSESETSLQPTSEAKTLELEAFSQLPPGTNTPESDLTSIIQNSFKNLVDKDSTLMIVEEENILNTSSMSNGLNSNANEDDSEENTNGEEFGSSSVLHDSFFSGKQIGEGGSITLDCSDSIMNATTPTTSHLKTPRHALRYIQDIKTPDLESPRRRRQCLSIMRSESRTMRSKMYTMKKQNTRLKQKVRNLSDLLKKCQKENI